MKIKLYFDNKVQIIEAQKGQSLMEIFNLNNIKLDFICAGNGICGKCKVQDINNVLPITKVDKQFLSQSQLDDGYRLACKAYPDRDIEIKFNYSEIIDYSCSSSISTSEHCAVVIDIGTTTIAMELISLDTGKTINSCTVLNSQKSFGADVIARIQSSINGVSKQLKKCIQNDILKGLKIIANGNRIDKIVISANTTIIHLLMGFDCSGLGNYPFSPYNLNKIETKFYKVFDSDLFDSDIIILPSISTYIGADIVSGMLSCDFDKSENNIMLIDIGTNAEMAIGNKNKILCTSAAAGPALEGGNISCGMGAVEGAISKIKIENNKFVFSTIGGKEAIGICGCAVIDIVSEALNNSLIDTTGLLKDELFDTGIEIDKNLFFTQQDIRQVQLAKSAIYSAISILTENYNDIDTVFIAGGLGYYIDIDNAINIGVIPSKFRNKIKIVGNSSLNGAKKYISNNDCDKRVDYILNISEEMYLANESNFNDLFIRNLNFNLTNI